MFYIWIPVRCYFASFSIDIFLFFTTFSLRYLSLKFNPSNCCYYTVYRILLCSESGCGTWSVLVVGFSAGGGGGNVGGSGGR